VTFRHASFIRRGKDLGLLLNRDLRKAIGETAPQPNGKKGDWVFDFAKHRLTDDLGDWKAARPQMGRWRSKLAEEERSILVLDGENRIATIAIPKQEKVSDF